VLAVPAGSDLHRRLNPWYKLQLPRHACIIPSGKNTDTLCAAIVERIAMPFIKIESGPDADVVRSIGSKQLSIGRSSQNDVILRDSTVSSLHAVILFLNETYFIEDRDSANGVYVNGIKVHRKRLRDGDEISLGKTRLRFQASSPTEQTAAIPIKRRHSQEIIRDFAPGAPTPESIKVLSRAHDNLKRVYEINKVLSSIFDINELAEKILDVIFPVFDADRGSIMLLDAESGELRLLAMKQREAESDDSSGIAFSRTIARRVLETEESIIALNAPEDERFSRGESIADAHIKSAMCVPISGRGEKHGVIYVDHRGSAGHFSEDQLQLLTMVANSAGIAIDNIRLYAENLKIHVLQAVNEEMRETNRKLMELEALKDDLINMVVHDMKNPVTNATMSLEMIERDKHARFTENQRKYLRAIKENHARLDEMIGNLLEISRMETGRMEFNPVDVEVPGLIDRTIRRYAVVLEAGKKTVHVSIEPGTQRIICDEHLFERIMANILSNAIKHSHTGGEILIRVAPADVGVLVSVEDNGEGIPKDYHESIFEKFSQAGIRELGHKTDTGLGLAFCKMAVEAHEGSIWVESEPGRGSCFTFSLPHALKGS
jgi:signal transduction histidine kinase